MDPRQLFDDVTTLTLTTAQPSITSAPAKGRGCAAVNLPAGGVISLLNGDVVTLTAPAAFRPTCTLLSTPAIIANGGGGSITIDETADGLAADPGEETQITDFHDPFYASTFPQCYALAATTIVAYTLVIMLLITPRSFLDGGVVVLGRKGFTNGGSGTNIGGRPWLQKVAALTVAISLTIATAATFRVAEHQYSNGVQNAKLLQEDVLGGNELKIIRIISDTFLWLAQAQTLIRLFPRQREKVIIKWTAFALITLDVIFQSLNSFQYTGQGSTRPRSFTDAVPALSYLFALALGVLYAAWVIYYSLMKKRYAFYHPQMKNICLVAALSMLAILVPVVFFILDISKPEFTGWGDYVRWVGAAAASVIVWEWVERIEALEREEKKDGILGREVFDGDEMMEVTPSDFAWSKRRRKGPDDGDGESGRTGTGGREDGTSTARGHLWPSVTSIASRYRSRSRPRKADRPGEPTTTQSTNNDRIRFLQPPLWPARPAPAVTPVSRTDTASAASTIYAVRYHPLTETTSRSTPPIQDNQVHLTRSDSNASNPPHRLSNPGLEPQEPVECLDSTTPSSGSRWRSLAKSIPIPRVGGRGNSPGKEMSIPAPTTAPLGVDDKPQQKRGGDDSAGTGRWDIRNRLEEFAVLQAERLRERIRPTPDTDSLPVTVIPAPPRRGAALAQLREEEELGQVEMQRGTGNSLGIPGSSSSGGGSASRTTPSSDDASSLQQQPQQPRIYRAGSSSSATMGVALTTRLSPAPVATEGSSSFSTSAPRNLPVTVIPAPPRRDNIVATRHQQSTEDVNAATASVTPGPGPSSPSP
ncbi:pH-response regulator protein palH/rim-21 [Apodospora peruviana]|uniref:PH-response regulator protein palH/rim-21 n=1 Tax=Apodospora peruviana TaxID=516989 RepID=A0AAE0M7W1_9PEZI|nr:pH-response regulator protein palH/rim-21 [Apodospora peruviana]